MRPPAGVWALPAPPASQPCYLSSGLLVFDGPHAPNGLLVFVCEGQDGSGPAPGKTIFIPLLKAYMTTHHLEAVLLPGGEPVTLLDVSLSADADNPGWLLTTSGPQSLMDQLGAATSPSGKRSCVMGINQGVMTRVKRTGTAGSLLAPQVADDLITHVDAARQRGRAILGAGGGQASITLSMPLLSGATIGQSGPGLLEVGQLLFKVTEPGETWRALVCGVSLSASLSSGELRQQLRVERHF